jgi:membrane associated rhomboid family serine protease
VTTPPAGGPGGAASVPDAPPVCYRHTDRETWIRCQRCSRPICPDCMRSAAVGFQCPNCVKEGSRSTRQARTPYGGQRVADPRLTTFVLIGLNAAVWLAITALGNSASSRLVDKLALLPASSLRTYPDGQVEVVKGVADGAYWQLVTSMFTHVEVIHIGFNMLALYFLGPTLEAVLGRARFLALYLVSGLAGSAAVMLFSNPHGQTLGASGAIFGLMGALAVLALKVHGQAQSVLMWIALNLVLTFTVSNISWQGHIGGLLGGALIGVAMVYAPRNNRALVQWSVTGLVLVISLVLVAARVAALS